jgi:hypothetical protein
MLGLFPRPLDLCQHLKHSKDSPWNMFPHANNRQLTYNNGDGHDDESATVSMRDGTTRVGL